MATPLPSTVMSPISFPLSRKLTAPTVGAGPDAALTVAVNVTDWPDTVVVLLEPSDVVVSIGLTVTVKLGESLVAKLVLPRNRAKRVWVPTDSVLVLVVSVPPPSVPEATTVAPSRKFTAPVGVPAADVTVADSDTGWPTVTDPPGPDAVVVVDAA